MRSAHGLTADTGVDWLTRAACRGHDPTWWEAATLADSVGRQHNREARRICRACPVRDRCEERANRLGAHGMIVAGRVWVQPGGQRYPTAGISMQCTRPGCQEVYTTSSNGRRRFCSVKCKNVEYERNNGKRRVKG